MTDKDGKELIIGSIVAIKKPGATNFTVKGTVTKFEGDIIYFKEDRRGFERPVRSPDVKRVKFKPMVSKRERARQLKEESND